MNHQSIFVNHVPCAFKPVQLGRSLNPISLMPNDVFPILPLNIVDHSQDIAPELRKKIGNRIFGCDDCLDICPFNINAQPSTEPHFQPTSWTLHPQLFQLASLSEGEFRSITKGSPTRRPKYEGFIRNAKIALQNQTPPPSSSAIQ